MLSKEEIEKDDNYWKGYVQKQKEAGEICKQCKYIKKARELETKEQKLIHELEYVLKDVQEDKRKNDLSMKLGELKINLRCYSVEEIELFITSILKILKGGKAMSRLEDFDDLPYEKELRYTEEDLNEAKKRVVDICNEKQVDTYRENEKLKKENKNLKRVVKSLANLIKED